MTRDAIASRPRRRVVLVGEAPGPNTRSDCPLFPYPENSAGGRLMRLAGMNRSRWLSVTARINLLPSYPVRWSMQAARDAAMNLMFSGLLDERDVVLVGVRVRDAFGKLREDPPFVFRHVSSVRTGSVRVAWIWHTSGRCRAWNDPDNARLAREFFAGLLNEEPT